MDTVWVLTWHGKTILRSYYLARILSRLVKWEKRGVTGLSYREQA